MIHIIFTLLGAFVGTVASTVFNPSVDWTWMLIGAVVGLVLSFGLIEEAFDIFD